MKIAAIKIAAIKIAAVAAEAAVTAVVLGAAAVACFAAMWLNPGAARFFKRELLISVAGDVLLDRGVANAIERNGAAYPYEGVSRIFNSDDITVANLECPLTEASGAAMKDKRFIFKADPGNAGVLKTAGFDVLALANNHTMDYLGGGLDDTMAALDGAGLLYAGAAHGDDNVRPCIINKNGVRAGVLSYCSLPPEGLIMGGGGASVAYARAGFLGDMRDEIAEAAAQCDFLLVYFHWGIEYRHDADESQIEIAHAAVDAGASAVVGAHPHVLQGREMYNGAPIYYSVGNFVFDKQIPDGTDEAIVLQLRVGRGGLIRRGGLISVDELPFVIINCQPVPADPERAAQIKSAIVRYSRRFN